MKFGKSKRFFNICSLFIVLLLFIAIFVFLNNFKFKSQNKGSFVLGCLLETVFSISAIISILLFLAKITILLPNYMISAN